MQHAPKKHEQAIQRDENGAPIIVKVSNHLVILERMQRFRAQALADQAESSQVLFYYAREKSALQVSIAALRYHRAAIQGLPTPAGILRELLKAWDEGRTADVGLMVEEARTFLNGFPANEDLQLPEGEYPEGETER